MKQGWSKFKFNLAAAAAAAAAEMIRFRNGSLT
jgi:hypothetical protein